MKHIPDDKQMEELLQNLLPDTSRRLDARLSNAPWTPRAVARRRFANATVMVMLIFTLMVAATPQGRAFAQDILKFFKRAESNVLPLSPDQIVPTEKLLAEPPAPPPAPIVSVTEAELAAGFDAKELPSVPKGFVFAGAMGMPGSISIQYEAQGGGSALVINESTNGFVQSEWDQAPVESISQVRVGELDGEIVEGAYVVYPGETVARWNPDAAIMRLRWVSDGLWIEMAKFGGVESIAYLDRDALLELAASLTNDPFPLEAKDAEEQAGFDVLEPSVLPEGITFLGSSFDPSLKMVSLSYGYSDEDRRILMKQQPADSKEVCDLCGLVGASATVDAVQIGDAAGEYALGVWELTDNGPVWRDDPYLKTIRWQKNGMAYELIYMGMEVEKDGLIAVAESMR